MRYEDEFNPRSKQSKPKNRNYNDHNQSTNFSHVEANSVLQYGHNNQSNINLFSDYGNPKQASYIDSIRDREDKIDEIDLDELNELLGLNDKGNKSSIDLIVN